jgi:hypothetical protein
MLKTFTLVLGVILLGVGLLGVVTGGHDHELIIFGINTTHNIVHLLSGALAVAAALAGFKMAKAFCLSFGVVYGLVAVAGFVDIRPVISMLNLNAADNWLHTAIAAGCLFFGATSKT